MDTIMFDGVTYTKAASAARVLKYTPDYLGQLCRGKKIDARLVGRTWFVNVESVLSHKDSLRQTKSFSDIAALPAVSADTDNKIRLSRPTIKLVTQRRAVKTPPDIIDHSRADSKSVPVSYEIDDGYLFPEIKKIVDKPPKTIVVEQAGAMPVKISSKERSTSFTATSLPEVSLSGTLPVTTYSEEATAESISPENKVISVAEVDEATPEGGIADNAIVPTKSKAKLLVKRSNPEPAVAMLRKQINPRGPRLEKVIEKVKFSPAVLPKAVQPKPSPVLMLSPAIALVFAILCAGVIFSASSTTVISKTSYNSEVVLQVANLLEIMKHRW